MPPKTSVEPAGLIELDSTQCHTDKEFTQSRRRPSHASYAAETRPHKNAPSNVVAREVGSLRLMQTA